MNFSFFHRRGLVSFFAIAAGLAAGAALAGEVPPPPVLTPFIEIKNGELNISVDIPPDTHIFAGRELLGFELQAEGATLGDWKMPRPEREETGPVYRDIQTFRAPLTPAAGSTRLALKGIFKYQPCLEVGQKVCYLPMSVPVDWQGTIDLSAATTAATTAALSPDGNPLLPAGDGTASAASCPPTRSGNPAPPGGPGNPFGGTPLKVLLLAFLGGLALNLTPCTWPLIPITLGVLGALGTDVRKARAVSMAVGFAAGLVVVYALLGLLAALLGKPFGALTQSPWLYLVMAGLFMLFGWLTIRGVGFELPAGMSQKIHSMRGSMISSQAGRAANPGHAAWLGVLSAMLIGALSGLIVSPCTGPVLAAALVHVAQSRDLLYGFSLFAAIGAGMALPFVFLGIFSARLSRLPRSGDWMEVVKKFLGAAIFFAAIYFMGQGLAMFTADQALRAAVLIGAGLLLSGMLVPWGNFAGRAPKFMLLIAVLLAVSVGIIHRPRALTAVDALWRTDYARAVADAARDKRPVIIDFWATWCAACKELDELTYATPEFQAAAAKDNFVLIKFNMTDGSSPFAKALAHCFRIAGLPTVIFMDAEGRLDPGLTLTGFEAASPFIERMRKLQ